MQPQRSFLYRAAKAQLFGRPSLSSHRLLEEQESLKKFEVAAIANLHPNEEEEAKALVKSLSAVEPERVTEDELKELLSQLATKRTYT